jgi:hypothetical protein
MSSKQVCDNFGVQAKQAHKSMSIIKECTKLQAKS